MNSSPRQHGLETLPVVRSEEFDNWPRDEAQPSDGPVSPKVTTGEAGSLDKAELKYLHAVIRHSGKPSSVYPKLARIGTKKALRIRQRLIELGYLREHQLQTGKKGRAAIVLEPLEKAIRLVGERSSS